MGNVDDQLSDPERKAIGRLHAAGQSLSQTLPWCFAGIGARSVESLSATACRADIGRLGDTTRRERKRQHRIKRNGGPVETAEGGLDHYWGID